MGNKLSKLQKSTEDQHYRFFHCPGCKCTHMIQVNSNCVRTGWMFNGDLEKPTVTPSILVNKGNKNPSTPLCHSYIKEGMIQFLGDCTHELAGQTVELPDWD